jgi:hypothetical protein
VFTGLEEQNRHLARWEATVADKRIHGTTKQQTGKVFLEVERSALLPLPAGRAEKVSGMLCRKPKEFMSASIGVSATILSEDEQISAACHPNGVSHWPA